MNDKIWDSMVAGEVYDATHPALLERLSQTRTLIALYNAADPADTETLTGLLHRILGAHGAEIIVNQPFYCDYGDNIRVGERFFANFHFTVLDEAPVTIGNDVFIGPNVSIYTACHPTSARARRTRREWARPVTIGDDVWIGGSVTILPGVTIGSGTTIGAGSVVTRDIPAGVIAAGNPCRVIKTAPTD